MSISGNMVGSYSQLGKTLVLIDENGNEIMGVVVGQETIFDATDNDVREGKTYASDAGVSVGTKVIPIYYASYGKKVVLSGREATIAIPEYDYSNLIVIISTYDTSLSQSVISTYVSVDDAMYVANGSTKVSDITVDKENEKINLGIVVNEKSTLRYVVIKEEY